MTEYKIKSKTFLPDTIRDYDLYTKMSEILDYVLDLYHTKNIDVLKALYDIKNSDFNAEKILELLGSSEFIEFNLSEEQMKTLCVLLSNLYEIKGTKRGLQYLLRLLDIECNVYEWYDINKWYYQGDPKWTHPVDPCTIVIELGLEHRPIGVCDKYNKWALPRTGSPAEEILGENQAFEDTEGKFRDFATRLLWVCVTLDEIRWARIFTDYVDVDSTFGWESAEIWYNKFSPFITNCQDTILVGFPIYQEFPYVGNSVNVGDLTYKGQAFLVRSHKEYNDPINYDGWDNVGTVGYSHQVISENLPLVGDAELYVGDKGYFWAWGYSESAQKEYLLWQKFLVGELWIEGDISPVSLHKVSGCQVSYIHSHDETAFENDYHVRRGIIVGYEDIVLPADNLGDGYVVDDHQGDILEAVAIADGLIEEVPVSEETNLHKEVTYASHISDLYELFLIGDSTKFVGDINLRVGQDYFFTWFELSKEIGFAEQFHTTCLQVGSWGHGYTEETSYTIYVGDSYLITGNTFFVGENIAPIEYKDRNYLLYTGTYLLVGSDNFVSPDIKIGQGFNYVGELAPWNNTGFVTNSNNIIYEWLEFLSADEFVEEEIPVFEQLETSFSEYELNSNIRDSLWNKLVGASPVVGSIEYFTVGSIYSVGYGIIGEYLVGETIEQQFVGNAPVVGHYEFDGTDYIATDPYCILTSNKKVNVAEEKFVFEAPVVGDTKLTVGYTGYLPIFVGSSVYKYASVGDLNLLVGYSTVVGEGHEEIYGAPHFVGDSILVGQAEFISNVDTYVNVSATGEIFTGKQNNILSVFEIQNPEEFSEDILTVDAIDDASLNSFEDKVFNNKIGDIYASNTYVVSATDVVGEIFVDPALIIGGSVDGIYVSPNYFVGQANYNVEADENNLFEVNLSEEIEQDIIYFNYPVVQPQFDIHTTVGNPDTLIGSGTFTPLIVGMNELTVNAEINIGGLHLISGNLITVGIEVFEQKNLSTLFVGNATVGQTSFIVETPNINSVIANSFLTCIIDEGQDIDISFIDTENSSSEIENTFFSEINENTYTNDNFESTFLMHSEELFNLNEILSPVILGSESSEVLILSPEENETNPVYLAAEQTEPYTFDSEFNPTNAINDQFSYLIDES